MQHDYNEKEEKGKGTRRRNKDIKREVESKKEALKKYIQKKSRTEQNIMKLDKNSKKWKKERKLE